MAVSRLRLVVTSRPEGDIVDKLKAFKPLEMGRMNDKEYELYKEQMRSETQRLLRQQACQRHPAPAPRARRGDCARGLRDGVHGRGGRPIEARVHEAHA